MGSSKAIFGLIIIDIAYFRSINISVVAIYTRVLLSTEIITVFVTVFVYAIKT